MNKPGNRQTTLASSKLAWIIAGVLLLAAAWGTRYLPGQGTQINGLPVTSPVPSGWKPYKSDRLGLRFDYPEILTVSEKDGVIDLSHSVPYKNLDGCNLSGYAQTLDNLTDFHVTLEIAPTKVVPEYTDGDYQTGSRTGVWRYEGAEGCGNYIYYLYLPDGRTLIVKNEQIHAFSGISTAYDLEEIMRIPGIISKEESKAILDRIVATVEQTNMRWFCGSLLYKQLSLLLSYLIGKVK